MPAPACESAADRRAMLPDRVTVDGVTTACLIEAVPMAAGDGHAPGGVVPVRLLCAIEDVGAVPVGAMVGPVDGITYAVADNSPDGTGLAVLTLTTDLD